MHYDPIKRSLGHVFNTNPILRKLFYFLLDLLLLRSWHIRKEIKQWAVNAPNNARILDAGAGFGQYVFFMSKLNSLWQITGVDVKQEQVADCNAFFQKIGVSQRVQYVEGDLTQYVSPQPVNAIVCVDVMEHIEADTDVFANFYTSLQSGGVLFISTPSDLGGSDVHDEHDESFVGEHVRDGYNAEDIRNKLQQAGFSTVHTYYSYGIFGSISWRLSMKYPIRMLNASKLFFVFLPFYYAVVFPICLLCNCIDVHSHNSKGTGLIVRAYK